MSSFKRIILIIGIAISLIIIAAPLTILAGLRPAGGAAQAVTIEEGTGRRGIAKMLAEKKLVRSELAFLSALILSNQTIMPGTYDINPKKSALDIMKILSKTEERRITLTIPEGWRREQIAQEITKKGLDGVAFLKLTEGKEGYLFPDTYFLPKDATAEQILEKFTQNFETRTKLLNPTKEQLILASIVEREAQKATDRPLIAGIYSNRIKAGIALEADPTVQYAKDTNTLSIGQEVESFWGKITVADYRSVISPFNTYINKSYPPAPICNPGLASIEAAVKPKSTNSLYFIHTPDGKTYTSTTLEGHRENVRKYLQ
jgi:UPF0755 protein